ncbi:MAG TPA: hypothetical protein VIM11_27320 [Tepidisphaeraceae bacterium]|jgi:hypothetical protein
MVALTNQEKQIVDSFQKLPADRRAQVILALAGTDSGGWARYHPQGEARLRELAAAQGLNWDSMSDELRQDFVEGLADEARS